VVDANDLVEPIRQPLDHLARTRAEVQHPRAPWNPVDQRREQQIVGISPRVVDHPVVVDRGPLVELSIDRSVPFAYGCFVVHRRGSGGGWWRIPLDDRREDAKARRENQEG